MKIIVLGGDGFCGWPTALHLSAEGWDVTIVDNLSRRNIDNELEVQSLTPIRTMGERIKAWKEVSGRDIGFVNMTVGKEFDRLVALIRDFAPDSVVHFAEQRAAPYSMKSARHKLYTVDNNLNATNHLLAQAGWARQRLQAHAGRTARIELAPLTAIDFSISAEGQLAEWSGEDAPEVCLRLAVAELPPLLAGGMESVMRHWPPRPRRSPTGSIRTRSFSSTAPVPPVRPTRS